MTTSITRDLKERVAKGLNFGIEAVEEVIDPTAPRFNDLVLLKSKYNDLMYMSSVNTLPYDQIEIGLDRLRNNLLGIIDDLDEKSIQKQAIDSDLKVHALPTRRTNFFKLLDIHFQNLEAIRYQEVFGSGADRVVDTRTGREALFQFYQLHRRGLRRREEEDDQALWVRVKTYFSDYFGNEIGLMEVYFKNVKHLLAYIMDSEIERQFFLDTIKSLFSRFELATIFYYALSELDPEFKILVKETNLVDPSVKSILIDEAHYEQL